MKSVRFRLFLRATSHTPLPVRAVAWRSRAKGFGWIVRSLFCRLALRHAGAFQAPLEMIMMMSRRATLARQGAPRLSTRASGRTAIARRATVLHSANRLDCGIRLLPDLVPHPYRLALPCLTSLPATPGQACLAWWLTARQARQHAHGRFARMCSLGCCRCCTLGMGASSSSAFWPASRASVRSFSRRCAVIVCGLWANVSCIHASLINLIYPTVGPSFQKKLSSSFTKASVLQVRPTRLITTHCWIECGRVRNNACIYLQGIKDCFRYFASYKRAQARLFRDRFAWLMSCL